ncbi:MAG TPA: ThuA domain-containing protein [Tepidisphaeraceae bacterium]|nr:ThuA domain-containing protein [Tepidisphaeraceae bacterium]
MKRYWVSLLAVCAVCFAAPVRGADDKNEPAVKPIKALLVLGGCCHDYAKQKDILTKGIEERANVEITIAYDPISTTNHLNPVYDNPDWYKGFDVIIHDECSADVTDLKIINDTILKPHKEGLPAVVLHCGMHCYRSVPYKKTTPWMEFTGMNTNHHGDQLPIAIEFTGKQSPIIKGMEDWTTIKEELYHQELLLPTAKSLAKGTQQTKDGPQTNTVIWTNEYNGKTRVFSTTLGHNNKTVSDPRYLDLVTRGLLWSVHKLDKSGKPKAGYGPRQAGAVKSASAAGQ